MSQDNNPTFVQEDEINDAVVGDSVVLEMGRAIEGTNAKQSLFSKFLTRRKRHKKTESTGEVPDATSALFSEPKKVPGKKKPYAWLACGFVLAAAAGTAWLFYGDIELNNTGTTTDTLTVQPTPKVDSSIAVTPMPAEDLARAPDGVVKVVPDDVLQSNQSATSLDVIAIAAQAGLAKEDMKDERSHETLAPNAKSVVDFKNLPPSTASPAKEDKSTRKSEADQANFASMDALLDADEISSDLLDSSVIAKEPPVAKLSRPLTSEKMTEKAHAQGRENVAPAGSVDLQKPDEKPRAQSSSESTNLNKSQPEPKQAPKAEVKPAPKAEVKPAPKAEPKQAPKAEPKPAPKAEPKPAPKAALAKTPGRAESKKVTTVEDISGFALPIRELLPNGKPVQTISTKPDITRTGVPDQRLANPRDAGGGPRVEVVHVGEDFALVTNPKTQLPMRVSLGQQLPNGATVISLDSKAGRINTNRGNFGMN